MISRNFSFVFYEKREWNCIISILQLGKKELHIPFVKTIFIVSYIVSKLTKSNWFYNFTVILVRYIRGIIHLVNWTECHCHKSSVKSNLQNHTSNCFHGIFLQISEVFIFYFVFQFDFTKNIWFHLNSWKREKIRQITMQQCMQNENMRRFKLIRIFL